jgi:pimeloyl-ACP methyl ester carboxylesterase
MINDILILVRRGRRSSAPLALPAEDSRGMIMVLQINHRTVVANGIQMHIAEAGEGPLVLLCHGFPEIWHSWRHQLAALAAAGWHVVAPDMRGYGRTDAPEEISSYSILHLIGDVVDLLAALGEERAAIVGHDWGATLAWTAAQIRPDVFRAVAALSVPMRPRGKAPPLALWRELGLANLYYFYFQEPGVAEAEFRRNRGWRKPNFGNKMSTRRFAAATTLSRATSLRLAIGRPCSRRGAASSIAWSIPIACPHG